MRPSKRQRKRLMTALIALIILGLGVLSERQGWNLPGQAQINKVDQIVAAGTYKVARFEDGDTITVEMDGKQETIRLIGVDTPEVKDPRKPVQCFGRAASEFTKNLIGSRPVRLESDPDNTNRDRYDRLLRYVYLPDGVLVNAEIIKQGYGFAYTGFPFTKKEEFKALEQQARQENKGLWNSCELTPNEYGGFTPNPSNE